MEEIHRETVIHNGMTFRRYPESSNKSVRKYFRATPYPGASCVYLHRVIWEDHNGKIPDGHVIHHIDNDKTNNNIDNLECISEAEHISNHSKTWFEDPINKAQSDQHLAEIRPLTKKWHASEEGLAWHRKNAKTSINAIPETPHTCEFCGKEYMSTITYRSRFCSNKCKSAWRRQSGIDDVDRKCVVCGKIFNINKYSKTKTCSRKCGGKLISDTRKKMFA